MFSLLAHEQPKSKTEVLVDDKWVQYDGHGTDTEKSREYYKFMTPIAEGSLPTRYNGIVAKEDSDENSVFYRSNN